MRSVVMLPSRRVLRWVDGVALGSVVVFAALGHLARAAARRVGYGDVRRVSPPPADDLATRHHLAAAELRRLGITAPPGWHAGLGGRPS